MINTKLESAQLDKLLVRSSHDLGWNGIAVKQYQSQPNLAYEASLPPLPAHLLSFPLGQPTHLTQKHDGRLYESLVQQSDLIFIPVGQPSYWQLQANNPPLSLLNIYLQPELVSQIAAASGLDLDRIDLTRCFARSDLQSYQIAMMMLAELESGGIMGRLYIESLTSVLVLHLLRHYSSSPSITADRHSLTETRLQRTIAYIHAHLDLDLSLVQIAEISNISPTHFARSFKIATGISLHQYVIKQRVERAKLLLKTTDLPIANIAFQVGFSSQSHLTQHCKRLTGMTPKQLSKSQNLLKLGQNLIEVE